MATPLEQALHRLRNPFQAALAQSAGPATSAGRAALSDEELAALAEDPEGAGLGSSIVGGISKAANVLGTPAGMVLNTLAGKNPLLGFLDPPQRTTGRKLLEQWDVLEPNQPGLDVGDVVGFGADVLADPLTYMTFGAGALGKLGQASRNAGLMDDAIRQAAKQGIGKRQFRLSGGLQDVIPAGAGAQPAREALERAAQGLGTTVDELADQTVGGSFGVGVPFMDPMFTVNLPGALGRSEKLDKLGSFISQTTPARILAAGFKPELRGTTSVKGQEMARDISAVGEAERAGRKEFVGRVANLTSDVTDRQKLRTMFEGFDLGQASPDTMKAYDLVRERLDGMLNDAERVGMNVKELQDEFAKFFPRHLSIDPRAADVATPGVAARPGRQYSGLDESQLHRLPFFKDLDRGTETIQQIAKDDGLNTAIEQGQSADDIAKYIKAKYAHLFHDPERIPEMASWFKEKSIEELRQAGLFANDPLQDLERHLLHRGEALDSAKGIVQHLAKHARTIAGPKSQYAGSTMSVSKILGKLGLEYGDKDRGAIVSILDVMGTPYSDDAAKELLKMRVDRDLAGDMVKYFDSFQTPQATSAVLQAFDSFTNLTKGLLTTPWPAFQMRNFVSGIYQNWVIGGLERKGMADAHRLLQGEVVKGASRIPIVKKTLSQRGLTGDEAASDILRELVRSHEVIGRHQGWGQMTVGPAPTGVPSGALLQRTFDEMAGEFPGGIGAAKRPVNLSEIPREFAGLTPETAWNQVPSIRGVRGAKRSTLGPLRAGEDLGYYLESVNRITPFVKFLKQGMDPRYAATKVGAAQVRYSNRHFTAFENSVLKRLFPFYSFTSRQIPFTLRQLWEHPGGKIAQTLKGVERMQEDNQLVPEHISDTAAVRIPEGVPGLGPEPGGDPRYLTGLGLMFEDPLQFLGHGASSEGLLREGASRLNPILKAPIELVTGTSLFQFGPEGGRPLEDMDPVLGRLAANVMGREKPVDFPDILEAVAANSPLSRALTSLRTVTDPRKGAAETAVNLGTGLRVYDVPQKVQDALLREAAEERLKGLGAKDFERVYIPKEELEKMSPQRQAAAQHYQKIINSIAERAKKRAEERKAKEAGAGAL